MRVSGEHEASLPKRGHAAEKGRSNRRQHARFVVRGKVEGRVTSVYDAHILDISLGGALIEHAHVVRPGSTSSLDLDLQGKRLSMRCRVARSVVDRMELQPDGEQILIYHTGLEFTDAPKETRVMISNYIQSVINDGKGTPTDEEPDRRSYTCEKCGLSFHLNDSEVRPAFIESRKRPVEAGDLFYYDHGTCQGTLMYTFGGPSAPWSAD
ncbi:MAG: PilZ domain-containing protein [Candidatus Methylomirabilales bacterium]